MAQGFCHSHYTYLTRGTLLKLDLSDRTHEAKAELMREFEQVAERFGMTPDELMTAAFFTVLKEGRKYENTNH